MDRQLKKKKIVTALLGICLVLVYVMIFCFSSDNAEESSALSQAVMDFIVDIYYKLAGGDGVPVVVDPSAVPLEEIIRKMAHFTEYMAVGFLSYGIVLLWMQKLHIGFMLVVMQLLLSGALDELHQYFVPGRYASLRDVMIDTTGGIAGIVLILMAKGIKVLWNRIQKQK